MAPRTLAVVTGAFLGSFVQVGEYMGPVTPFSYMDIPGCHI